ncbi:heterokaryon incompatibility protein-domain-containing protein, partial [Cercophora newfieldiana]
CPPSLSQFLPLGHELPGSTSSEESLSWAKDQLRTCIKSHPNCKATSASFFPARVLDIACDNQGGSGVRLLTPQEDDRLGETYVCLSHCWGNKPFLRTISTNLEDHKKGIAWDELPPNFQDAIGFTRRLGLRYIWIDSLCIVQDDKEDWRRESARMASIFEHAFLVLSATKAADAYQGIYADFPEACKTHTIRIPRSMGRTGTKTWIFQERLLSTRVLHFGPEELAWECLEAFTCQCGSMPGLSDILPAISGLAKHFQKARKSAYVAGLWRDDMPRTLLW